MCCGIFLPLKRLKETSSHFEMELPTEDRTEQIKKEIEQLVYAQPDIVCPGITCQWDCNTKIYFGRFAVKRFEIVVPTNTVRDWDSITRFANQCVTHHNNYVLTRIPADHSSEYNNFIYHFTHDFSFVFPLDQKSCDEMVKEFIESCSSVQNVLIRCIKDGILELLRTLPNRKTFRFLRHEIMQLIPLQHTEYEWGKLVMTHYFSTSNNPAIVRFRETVEKVVSDFVDTGKLSFYADDRYVHKFHVEETDNIVQINIE